MKKKLLVVIMAAIFTLGASLLLANSKFGPSASAKADRAQERSISAQRGPNGGPVCVYNDHNFSGEFTSFWDTTETPRHCFRSGESIGHFGSLRNEVDDNISSITNDGESVMCFYLDPDFTGLALEVNGHSRVNLNGPYSIFNDKLTSMRPC
ncbi:peptidase inhibitor family I36 protein [Streptomyces bauhiniae]